MVFVFSYIVGSKDKRNIHASYRMDQNVFWKKLNYSSGEAHLSSSILGEKPALALPAERDGTEFLFPVTNREVRGRQSWV